MNKNSVLPLQKFWKEKQKEIENRLRGFETVGKTSSPENIFYELSFCLLTPQSKARTCWNAVEKLKNKNLIFNGTQKEIAAVIGKIGVRFKNNKAKYLIEARRLLKNLDEITASFKPPLQTREWLVKNVKGMGYKEASHFLRNIGYGKNIAILDRHILKNLKFFGVIKDIPKTITPGKYIEIEDKMKIFSKNTSIPLSHLDLLFWCRETGEVYK